MAGRVNSVDENDDDLGAALLPSKKLGDVRSPLGLFLYLKANPNMIAVFLMLLFSVAFVGVAGAFYYIDFHRNTVFFSAGVFGVAFNVYKYNHFRTLMELKKEINKYTKANQNFKATNEELVVEINKFAKAKGGK